ADMMRTREVPLRGNDVAGLQLAGIDALADDALNALVGRQSAGRAGVEALKGGQRLFVRSHRLHLFNRNEVSFERKPEGWFFLAFCEPIWCYRATHDPL